MESTSLQQLLLLLNGNWTPILFKAPAVPPLTQGTHPLRIGYIPKVNAGPFGPVCSRFLRPEGKDTGSGIANIVPEPASRNGETNHGIDRL